MRLNGQSGPARAGHGPGMNGRKVVKTKVFGRSPGSCAALPAAVQQCPAASDTTGLVHLYDINWPSFRYSMIQFLFI